MNPDEKYDGETTCFEQFKGKPWSSWIASKERQTQLDLHKKSIGSYSEGNTLNPQENRDADMICFEQFRGKPWSSWITSKEKQITLDLHKKPIESYNEDCRVTRLPRQDIGLFGMCPESDQFLAVLCSICGSVVKPQGLRRHIEIKHPAEAQSLLLPPPPLPIKKKSLSVKVKPKEAVTSVGVHSDASSIVTTVVVQPSVIAVKSSESSSSSANCKLTIACKTPISSQNEIDPVINNQVVSVSRKKSPGISNDKKRSRDIKDKLLDVDKNSVQDESAVSSSARNLIKTQVIPSVRRTVTSRVSKDISKPTLAQRTAKDQHVQSACTTPAKSRVLPKILVAVPELPESASLSGHTVMPKASEPAISNQLPMNNKSAKGESNTREVASTVLLLSSNMSHVQQPVATAMPTNDLIPSVKNTNHTTLTTSVKVSAMKAKSVAAITPLILNEVIQFPVKSQPTYSVRIPSAPVLILNNHEAILPAVNLNVNTESTMPVTVFSRPAPRAVSILKPLAPLKVPSTVHMPPLQENVSNITLYKNYPKPISLNNFSPRKVGGALVFGSKRLDVLRNEFKSVLAKKARSVNNLSIKTVNQGTKTTTIFTTKSLSANNTGRFPKTISVIPSISATSILANRPNILRTSPKPGGTVQHVPKILATGIKRPSSSPQVNLSECKHLLITPGTASTLNGIIGKMIVHPHAHEVSDTTENSTANHIGLEKVVPVNIK